MPAPEDRTPSSTHPPGVTPADAPQDAAPTAETDAADPSGPGAGEVNTARDADPGAGDGADPGAGHEPDADFDSDGPGVSREQYEAATAERDELKNELLRARAETDNARKRAARDRDADRRYAAVPLAKSLLPGLDDLHRAVEAARASREAGGDAEKLAGDLVGGVSSVLAALEKALSEHGIEPIPAVGEAFDPHRHEALTQAPSLDHPPGTVIQEARRGYAAADRVLRPAQVIVATAPAA